MPEEMTIAQRMQRGLDLQLVDIVENGEPVRANGEAIIDPDTGQPIRMPPSAAMLNVVRQRLKELAGQGGDDTHPIQAALEQIRQAQDAGGDLPSLDDEMDDLATS